MFAKLRQLSDEQKRDLRIALALTLFAIVLYAPGVSWGVQDTPTAGGLVRGWAIDEMGPSGPLIQVRAMLTGGRRNPQYPLFHYVLLLMVYSPYLLWQWLTGGLALAADPETAGFRDPVAALSTLLLISRWVSVVMGGACVAVAYLIAKTLWDRLAGALAAVCAMMVFPMFYYARTSNVDVPALFWCALTLLVFVKAMKDGLTNGRAVALGVLAALAVATKDQSYAALLFLPVPLVVAQFYRPSELGVQDARSRWKPLLLGGVVCLLVYALASGLAIRPGRFLEHLRFIASGSAGGKYFRFPATASGYLALGQESAGHLVTSLGWPLLVAAGAGIVLCWREARWKLALLLPIPGLILGVLVPVRHVQIRFLLVIAFVLACFAGAVLARGLRASRVVRALTAVVMLAGLGWQAARAADFTWLLLHDPRVDAQVWLSRFARPGDTIEFFPGPDRSLARTTMFPRSPAGVRLVPAEVGAEPGQGRLRAEFVITMGPEDQENFRVCPQWVFEGLSRGELGYGWGESFRATTRFPIPYPLNQRIVIFVRQDRLAEINKQSGTAPR